MGVAPIQRTRELILNAARLTGSRVFIETGTLQGDTAAWASGRFERVVTVEGDSRWYGQARDRLAGLRNVSVVLGDSAEALEQHVPRGLDERAVFWLDAHWMGGTDTAKPEGRECPLVWEVAAIDRSEAARRSRVARPGSDRRPAHVLEQALGRSLRGRAGRHPERVPSRVRRLASGRGHSRLVSRQFSAAPVRAGGINRSAIAITRSRDCRDARRRRKGNAYEECNYVGCNRLGAVQRQRGSNP